MSDSPESRWAEHDSAWRDPASAVAGGMSASVDPALLRMRATGDWWELIEALGITLLVTREYEHLVMAVTVVDGTARASYLALPHPSGLAVDRERSLVAIASTRNPNQVYWLEPVSATLPRADVSPPAVTSHPLMPLRSTIYPGALYIHDLAFLDGELHANSVGQNVVVRLPPGGGHQAVWWPRCVERHGKPDVSRNWIQLNSIAAGHDLASSYFTASAAGMSARRPGHLNFPVDRRGVVFSGQTREPVATGLTRPHSARLYGERVWVDDSGYGGFGYLEDGRLEVVASLPGWTRGLCLCERIAFVGTSRVIPRFAHYAPGLDVDRSRCSVCAVDLDSGRVLGSLRWPAGNQIFAVDWMHRSTSAGLPYIKGGRGAAGPLFYSFEPPIRGRRDE